jgi:hypothetical protein
MVGPRSLCMIGASLGGIGMRPRVKSASLILAAAFAIAALAVAAFDMSTDLSPSDKRYAALILTSAGYDPDHLKKSQDFDFETEIRSIVAVQDAVLKAAPVDRAIPFGHEREPKDIYELKYGLCYDRSRVIEKILAWLGFRVRHVSVYSTNEVSWVRALLKPQVDSHAVTEVLTSKGWMVIDSNKRWIGLSSSRDAISLTELQSASVNVWAPESRDSIHPIFTHSFIQIRGLYSRHGYFYPPYNPVPDYDIGQLLENFRG